MKMNWPMEIPQNTFIMGVGGGQDILGTLPFIHNRPDIILGTYDSTSFDIRDYVGNEVYTFPKLGPAMLKPLVEKIIKKHEVSTILLVDGGVDSLMFGDEDLKGTVLEEYIFMAAIKNIQLYDPRDGGIFLVNMGFGTETEENLNHYRVMENMAALSYSGQFYGTCALTRNHIEYVWYRHICDKIWETNKPSHVQSKIISAIEGRFGDDNMYKQAASNLAKVHSDVAFINPLMPIYWFFDMGGVYQYNEIIEELIPARTKGEAYMKLLELQTQTRDKKEIPL